jgi:hypothetical protein
MKKLMIATAALLFLSTMLVRAQEAPKKRKPGFSLDAATMTELGVTPEQQQKIEASKQTFRIAAKKWQDDGAAIVSNTQKRVDSVLTAEQKQKATAMQELVKTQNKENPAQKKTFAYDQKTIEELGLSADQQQKLKTILAQDHVARWQHSQKWNKQVTEAVKEQEDVLTEVQKKKVAEIKESIAAYNKTIQ